RTGRAGHSGVAISFCEMDEIPFLKDIEKLIGKTIPEVKDHPYPMQMTAQPAKMQGSTASAVATKPARPARPAKPKANPPLKPRSEWFRKGSKTSR
ncbi:ATP-dependent helicase, partial [Paenibacillus sepulcri]|nr:ATP-dependent helicase [Paenibacillus sepulcri]